MSSDVTKSLEQVYTPYPYHPGHSITLRDSNGNEFSVDIIHEYSFTISPAVVVNLHEDGAIREAVLKLYDRRFGELRKRREPDGRRRPQPHTEESEAAFQDFARSGMLGPVLDRLRHADLMWDLYRQVCTPPDEEDEEMKPERERLAEEEAEFYYKIQKRYTREVRAYGKLKCLQGRGIPRFFTAVTLQMPSAPPDLELHYFQVPGILIEKINGFNLSNLVTEMPAGPPDLWAEIVQKATDLAVEINRAGVLDGDSQPRNALVTRREDNTHQVCRIDFGEASLESDLKFRREDEPDYFKQCAATSSNPDALGLVMAAKVKRLTGVELDIVFDEIFPGIDGLP
ncbi:hypothetical protein NUW58_g263 [Xylaria curta]|uniref:Uncharacterized protein n=1 Tax=Xylaria curta TaxID=42375 RepID=A0ACC1PSF2_9PEZI|nr:hypothetical protein NUW58_g263 [Xylaria curta]